MITFVAILVSFSSLIAVPIDISEAEITITGSMTFTMNNVYSNGNYYWIDFEWNRQSNYFKPVDFGPEVDFRRGDIIGENTENGQDVVINILNAIPKIFTSNQFRLYNVLAFGRTHWGAWGWNDITNTFETYYYGEEGSVTDIEGNVYRTVKIGNQWWMAENLKVTHYRNGALIPTVENNSEWESLTTGAYCAYGNNFSYVPTYGLLYNWYAVKDSRNIAPQGWHVPSDDEFETLESYLGGSGIAGGKMKEVGTSHWGSPNTEATNSSEYTAIPGGFRRDCGIFKDMGVDATFWSSTEVSSSYAWSRYVYCYNSEVYRYSSGKRGGFSVRCVRD
jgi:uncharacterized protein (TIGR02145 family)